MQKPNSMRKTFGNVFLGHLGGKVFHVFPRLQSIMGQSSHYEKRDQARAPCCTPQLPCGVEWSLPRSSVL